MTMLFRALAPTFVVIYDRFGGDGGELLRLDVYGFKLNVIRGLIWPPRSKAP